MSRRTSESSKEDTAKRNKPQHSCTECHRRKQKCDRNVPCQHCIARGLPLLCSIYEPEKPALTTEERLTQLEGAIKAGFEAVLSRFNTLQQQSFDHQSPSSIRSDLSLRTPAVGKKKEAGKDLFEPLSTVVRLTRT
jgi:hypothetical protein